MLLGGRQKPRSRVRITAGRDVQVAERETEASLFSLFSVSPSRRNSDELLKSGEGP